ncbi:MAG: hypothetical protein AAFX99_12660, partial [Myxococcota bacterium]
MMNNTIDLYGRRCGQSVAVLLVGLVAVSFGATSVEAKGGKGALYVNEFFAPQAIKEKKFAPAQIYIYTTEGTLIHSGKDKGQHKPGELIELDPGDYLVEVGRHRTRHNLQRYTVSKNQVTVVKTGWVAATTWARDEQPAGDHCRKWSAELRVLLVVDKLEYLISSNTDLFPGTHSMVQVPVGTYRVYFNGLAKEITVEEDTIHNLPLGTAGPFKESKVRLASDNSDKAGVQSVGLCDHKPSHVLSGTWWQSHTVRIEEHPYEKQTWKKITVPAQDGGNTRSLPPDKVLGQGGHLFGRQPGGSTPS